MERDRKERSCLTCSLYWLMSSNDLLLLTANTQRNPSPVRMYWSLMALEKEIRMDSVGKEGKEGG